MSMDGRTIGIACMSFLARLAVAAALFMAPGCEPSPTSGEKDAVPRDTVAGVVRDTMPLVQTQELRYEITPNGWGRGATIPFAYRNISADTFYIVNCSGAIALSIEKLDSAGWKHVWSPIIQLCLSPPVTIAPGAVYNGVANFSGVPFGSNAYPQLPAGDLDGTYRLRLANVVLHYDSRRQGFGDQVPVEKRVSNAFLIVDP
jgi:hypothetical protein